MKTDLFRTWLSGDCGLFGCPARRERAGEVGQRHAQPGLGAVQPDLYEILGGAGERGRFADRASADLVQRVCFAQSRRQFRERDTYRYLKCPSCKAQLRVRAIKGKHNVRCPKCGSEFEKKI